jgi:hypothetical protein
VHHVQVTPQNINRRLRCENGQRLAANADDTPTTWALASHNPVSGQLPIYRPLIRHIKLTIGVARVIDVVNWQRVAMGVAFRFPSLKAMEPPIPPAIDTLCASLEG